MKNLTEDETKESNEPLSESDESIHHIEEIQNIEEEQKQYTAKTKINSEMQKEFKIDTGSPVIPIDKRLVKQIEMQKLTNRYQDVKKNKVNFWGKISVKIEYEKRTNRKWKS